MTKFLQLLEDATEELKDYKSEDDSPNNESLEGTSDDDKKVLEELNRLYTPVLIRRKLEQNVALNTKLELTESNQYNERTTINFDSSANYDQLVLITARLLQKNKNTDNWQAFVKANEAKKQADINMQNEESEKAKSLAKEFLIAMSKSNNSSIARDSAMDILSSIS